MYGLIEIICPTFSLRKIRDIHQSDLIPPLLHQKGCNQPVTLLLLLLKCATQSVLQ